MAGAAAWHAHTSRSWSADIPLYLDGIGVADGEVVPLPAGADADFLDGTRVLVPGEDASTQEIARAQRTADAANAWLDSGTVPGQGGPFEDMARGALLDLHALTEDTGALVAAPYPYWDHAWPRDNAFAAVALAQTGHVADAVRILEFFARVQRDDGGFAARYLIDGSGNVPDERPDQLDGVGWLTWASSQVVKAAPAEERADVALRLEPMLDRSAAFLLALVDNPAALPPVSPDYWETPESRLTLGTAAPVLAGLQAATQLYTGLGREADAAATELASTRLAAAIEDRFGSRGYPRLISGGASDTATAFVLPPFVTEPLAGAPEAWSDSIAAMLRPAGGLAPGGSWRKDGVSWTPETAIYALAAAHLGDTARAENWLHWLNQRRTSSGALPEKVLADGSPAAVAPLSWTNATVLLTLVELDRQTG